MLFVCCLCAGVYAFACLALQHKFSAYYWAKKKGDQELMIYYKITMAQQEIEASVMEEMDAQHRFLIKTGLKGGSTDQFATPKNSDKVGDTKPSKAFSFAEKPTKMVAPETLELPGAGLGAVKEGEGNGVQFDVGQLEDHESMQE